MNKLKIIFLAIVAFPLLAKANECKEVFSQDKKVDELKKELKEAEENYLYRKAEVEKLKAETEDLIKQFAGKNLERLDFTGIDLRGAKFKGAKLKGAKFTGADLREADFNGADLREADFEGAKLQKADLRKAKLEGANFTGADLYGALWSVTHVWDLKTGRLVSTEILGVRLTETDPDRKKEELAEAKKRGIDIIQHRIR